MEFTVIKSLKINRVQQGDMLKKKKNSSQTTAEHKELWHLWLSCINLRKVSDWMYSLCYNPTFRADDSVDVLCEWSSVWFVPYFLNGAY